MISGASDEELDIAIARANVLLELQPKINELKKENQKYKEVIDKAIKLIEDEYYSSNTIDINSIAITSNKLLQVRKILNEVK